MQSNSVALSNEFSCEFSVDRLSKYRALAWLEDAGLISVRRKLGQSPVVTLREPREDAVDNI